MSTIDSRRAMTTFLQGEFRREQGSGFARLRRIPSTSVRMFLDYFVALDRSAQDALCEGLVQLALSWFFPSAPHPYESGNIAYKRYIDTLPLTWDWKYQGTRELRMILAAAKLEPDSSWGRSMTNEIKEWIEAIKPVKSAEIRKMVKLALSQLLTPVAVKHEGQYWLYSGIYKGRVVSVTIDYSGKHHQLDYWVSVRNEERGLTLESLNFERILGLSFAQWDCLEQANLDQSIALLKDLIAYCVEISRRLPAVYK